MYIVLRTGSKHRLGWGSDGSGNYRGRDFYKQLGEKERIKFEPWFERIVEGIQITNPEKFRHEGDQLYVFKSHRYRLACFFDGRNVVMIDGFEKKEDRSRRVDQRLQTAKRLRDDYLKRKKGSS